ncbi:MAG: hypothetical protein PHV98_07385, partial [Candidatus Omnitrophica bacterium]|nr:hypothetical protein [Candidatus Omnitrophota bacterium]
NVDKFNSIYMGKPQSFDTLRYAQPLAGATIDLRPNQQRLQNFNDVTTYMPQLGISQYNKVLVIPQDVKQAMSQINSKAQQSRDQVLKQVQALLPGIDAARQSSLTDLLIIWKTSGANLELGKIAPEMAQLKPDQLTQLNLDLSAGLEKYTQLLSDKIGSSTIKEIFTGFITNYAKNFDDNLLVEHSIYAEDYLHMADFGSTSLTNKYLGVDSSKSYFTSAVLSKPAGSQWDLTKAPDSASVINNLSAGILDNQGFMYAIDPGANLSWQGTNVDVAKLAIPAPSLGGGASNQLPFGDLVGKINLDSNGIATFSSNAFAIAFDPNSFAMDLGQGLNALGGRWNLASAQPLVNVDKFNSIYMGKPQSFDTLRYAQPLAGATIDLRPNQQRLQNFSNVGTYMPEVGHTYKVEKKIYLDANKQAAYNMLWNNVLTTSRTDPALREKIEALLNFEEINRTEKFSTDPNTYINYSLHLVDLLSVTDFGLKEADSNYKIFSVGKGGKLLSQRVNDATPVVAEIEGAEIINRKPLLRFSEKGRAWLFEGDVFPASDADSTVNEADVRMQHIGLEFQGDYALATALGQSDQINAGMLGLFDPNTLTVSIPGAIGVGAAIDIASASTPFHHYKSLFVTQKPVAGKPDIVRINFDSKKGGIIGNADLYGPGNRKTEYRGFVGNTSNSLIEKVKFGNKGEITKAYTLDANNQVTDVQITGNYGKKIVGGQELAEGPLGKSYLFKFADGTTGILLPEGPEGTLYDNKQLSKIITNIDNLDLQQLHANLRALSMRGLIAANPKLSGIYKQMLDAIRSDPNTDLSKYKQEDLIELAARLVDVGVVLGVDGPRLNTNSSVIDCVLAGYRYSKIRQALGLSEVKMVIMDGHARPIDRELTIQNV